MSSNGDGSAAAAAMAANIQPGGGYGIYERVGDQQLDNLQYNMLGCWVYGTIVSSTIRLMFQVVFFFIISCKILCKNPFIFFIKLQKMKRKSFEYPKSIRNMKKNTWNVRRLVDESFVLATQSIILKMVGFVVA